MIGYIMEPNGAIKSLFWNLPIEDRTERDHLPPAEVRSRPPLLRGYWLDHELMAVTGIGSDAVLKKLQAADAIRASYIGLPEGGRQRAWAARNVFRSYLAAQLAKYGRMSLVAAGTLVGALRPRFIDEELQIDRLLADLQRRVEQTWSRPAHLDELPLLVSRVAETVAPADLVLEDWVLGFWATPEGGRRRVLRIRKLDGSHPDVSGIVKDGSSGDEPTATLRIDIRSIVRGFLRDLALSG